MPVLDSIAGNKKRRARIHGNSWPPDKGSCSPYSVRRHGLLLSLEFAKTVKLRAEEYLKRHALTSLGAESRLDPVAELQVVPGFTPCGGLFPPRYASLIGRTIYYRDRKLWLCNQITKCFVNDVGWSELRGNFYEVIFNDEELLTILEEEMMDILSRETNAKHLIM